LRPNYNDNMENNNKEIIKILGALAEAASKFKWAYIISIFSIFIVLLITFLLFRSIILDPMILENVDIMYYEELLASLLTTIIIYIIILELVFIPPTYFLYSGSKTLKEAVEANISNQIALQLRTPASLLYYGALLSLIGVITIIILIGFIILFIGGIIFIFGLISLGLNIKNIDNKYSTIGNLLVITGILGLASFIIVLPTEISISLSILSTLLGIYVFYELENLVKIDINKFK